MAAFLIQLFFNLLLLLLPIVRCLSPEAELCDIWLPSRCRYLNDSRARPVLSQKNLVPIWISFSAKRLLQLSDLEQRMSIQGKFQLNWMLEGCEWHENNAETGLTEEARLVDHCTYSSSSMWQPRMITSNAYYDVYCFEK